MRCERAGRVRAAEHVDHVVPLEFDGEDDESNMQALCVDCHEAKTTEDRRYRVKPKIGADGYPIEGGG